MTKLSGDKTLFELGINDKQPTGQVVVDGDVGHPLLLNPIFVKDKVLDWHDSQASTLSLLRTRY